MTGIHTQGVVVGVDETAESRTALAFAMREAAMRGSALEVVTTWARAGYVDSATTRPEQGRQLAQEIQDDAVAKVLEQLDSRPVLSRQVVEGDAGEVLLRVSKDAAYLVLGASNETGSERVLLGAVSDYCLRHSTCAVVVVPLQSHCR